MKTIQELDAIYEQMQSQINLRRHHEGSQVMVAAGDYAVDGLARKLVAAFLAKADAAKLYSLAIKLYDAPAGEVKTIIGGETKTYTDVTVEKVDEIYATLC